MAAQNNGVVAQQRPQYSNEVPVIQFARLRQAVEAVPNIIDWSDVAAFGETPVQVPYWGVNLRGYPKFSKECVSFCSDYSALYEMSRALFMKFGLAFPTKHGDHSFVVGTWERETDDELTEQMARSFTRIKGEMQTFFDRCGIQFPMPAPADFVPRRDRQGGQNATADGNLFDINDFLTPNPNAGPAAVPGFLQRADAARAAAVDQQAQQAQPAEGQQQEVEEQRAEVVNEANVNPEGDASSAAGSATISNKQNKKNKKALKKAKKAAKKAAQKKLVKKLLKRDKERKKSKKVAETVSSSDSDDDSSSAESDSESSD